MAMSTITAPRTISSDEIRVAETGVVADRAAAAVPAMSGLQGVVAARGRSVAHRPRKLRRDRVGARGGGGARASLSGAILSNAVLVVNSGRELRGAAGGPETGAGPWLRCAIMRRTMAIVVQKYGGSSVADVSRLQ